MISIPSPPGEGEGGDGSGGGGEGAGAALIVTVARGTIERLVDTVAAVRFGGAITALSLASGRGASVRIAVGSGVTLAVGGGEGGEAKTADGGAGSSGSVVASVRLGGEGDERRDPRTHAAAAMATLAAMPGITSRRFDLGRAMICVDAPDNVTSKGGAVLGSSASFCTGRTDGNPEVPGARWTWTPAASSVRAVFSAEARASGGP